VADIVGTIGSTDWLSMRKAKILSAFIFLFCLAINPGVAETSSHSKHKSSSTHANKHGTSKSSKHHYAKRHRANRSQGPTVEEIPQELLERDQPVVGHAAGSYEDDSYAPPSDDDQRPQWERPQAKRWREPAPAWSASIPRTRGRGVGKEVYHEDFGRGVVVAVEGQGGDARYTVRFGTRMKKILGRFLTEGSHVE